VPASTTDLGTLLRRWIDVLAATYFAQCEAWRARRSLIVTYRDGTFVIRKAPDRSDRSKSPEQSDSPVLAAIGANERVPAEVSRLARAGFVTLELPIGSVAVRRIAVPAQARDFVGGIVRNQIERLSPWRSDQATFGFDAEIDAKNPATLEVRVLIASRAAVDEARDQLAAVGLSADRVAAPVPNADTAKAVTLWSRLADFSPEKQARMRRDIGLGISATVGASLCFSAWAIVSAESIRGTGDEVAARTDTLRRQTQAPLTLQSSASLPTNQRAWYEKEASPSATIMLEALSRALPDTAQLTELSLQGATVRIAGLSDDAPSLIAPLERSGYFTNVRFSAPTVRGPDDKHFSFHIEGRVEPRVKLSELGQ
jgi:general secretion pathway protein L